ncbi:unnamed protein product [Brachionus calyciflorus]|uniref:MARVEL domain-containing protein n=1 Tax=Brachionus calyciflorus TaxID=104777 RepID=A0A814BCW3_9BILA|nr:unnamed protein product [Brachionus calyciflorus]
MAQINKEYLQSGLGVLRIFLLPNIFGLLVSLSCTNDYDTNFYTPLTIALIFTFVSIVCVLSLSIFLLRLFNFMEKYPNFPWETTFFLIDLITWGLLIYIWVQAILGVSDDHNKKVNQDAYWAAIVMGLFAVLINGVIIRLKITKAMGCNFMCIPNECNQDEGC